MLACTPAASATVRQASIAAGHAEGTDPRTIAAVYKPTLGERPFDDFPDGTLTRREVAAWLVSEASGWGIVPPTILREGPFGDLAAQWAAVEAPEDADEWEADPRELGEFLAQFVALALTAGDEGKHVYCWLWP